MIKRIVEILNGDYRKLSIYDLLLIVGAIFLVLVDVVGLLTCMFCFIEIIVVSFFNARKLLWLLPNLLTFASLVGISIFVCMKAEANEDVEED